MACWTIAKAPGITAWLTMTVATVPSRTAGRSVQPFVPPSTLVVGAHHEPHVLDGDDEQNGPEDQRQHAEQGGGSGLAAARLQRLAQRVDQAGADVAETTPSAPMSITDRNGRSAAASVDTAATEGLSAFIGDVGG
jgi:hypothetical protein